MTDVREAVHTFLLEFVEGRDRSRASAARVEALLAALASDERFNDLQYALALYDGREGAPSEPGLLNQDGFASQCRLSLHDLDDHRYCQHPRR